MGTPSVDAFLCYNCKNKLAKDSELKNKEENKSNHCNELANPPKISPYSHWLLLVGFEFLLSYRQVAGGLVFIMG